MKSLFLGLLLASSAVVAEGLPAGEYLGKGTWFDTNGRSGVATYQMTMSYNKNESVGTYSETGIYSINGTEETFEWKASTTSKLTSKHTFDVFYGVFRIGSGVCMRHQDGRGVCTETVDSPVYYAAETQEYFPNGTVHRTGIVRTKLLPFGPIPAKTAISYTIDYVKKN